MEVLPGVRHENPTGGLAEHMSSHNICSIVLPVFSSTSQVPAEIALFEYSYFVPGVEVSGWFKMNVNHGRFSSIDRALPSARVVGPPGGFCTPLMPER